MYYMHRLLHFQDNNTKEVKKMFGNNAAGLGILHHYCIYFSLSFELKSRTSNFVFPSQSKIDILVSSMTTIKFLIFP